VVTGARLGGTNSYSVGYHALLRPQTPSVQKISNGATVYSETDGYDAAGNVSSVNTTLPTGTDNQGYCYDEQNRLTWAGTSGSKPCGGSVTAGSLTGAAYTNTFAYDTLDRLTSGPAGSYSYGDAAHKHAATAVGSGYTAKYDASGNMTCRAPSSSQTCSGTITGAALTYDNEGRLTAWQNAQFSPTSTDSYLYDGEGNRVAQQSMHRGRLRVCLAAQKTDRARCGNSAMALFMRGQLSFTTKRYPTSHPTGSDAPDILFGSSTPPARRSFPARLQQRRQSGMQSNRSHHCLWQPVGSPPPDHWERAGSKLGPWQRLLPRPTQRPWPDKDLRFGQG
jgi:hypothetical protein